MQIDAQTFVMDRLSNERQLIQEQSIIKFPLEQEAIVLCNLINDDFN